MQLEGRALAGTIVSVAVHQKARTPAYLLVIDFGPAGKRRSSAQITDRYRPEDLLRTQIVALVDLPPKRIAGVVSECLVLGLPSPDGVVLLRPERPVADGSEVY